MLFRSTFELAPSEAVPVVYGAMANWEHLKGLAGEPEDAQFRNALNQAYQEALPIRAEEKVAQAKAEADRQAAQQAAAQKKMERATAKVAAQQAKAQKAAKKKAKTVVASSNSPANSAGSPRNDISQPKEGILSQMAQAVKDNLNNAPTQLTDNLMRDGKSAINSVIRQGMKSVIKGLLSK